MKKYFYILVSLSILLIGCNQSQSNQEVANIPDAGPPRCNFHDVEAYNLSLGSYRAHKSIKYFVANKPALMDSTKAQVIVEKAWKAWSEYIEKPIIHVLDKASADIVIRFDNMDGRGGMLGQAEFPPYDNFDTIQRSVVFDNYDLVQGNKEGAAVFDFFTTAVHEFGHSLGLKHCDDVDAIMFWQYNGIKNKLTIDDIVGIREKYNTDGFNDWNGKRFKYFARGIAGHASKNFELNEFYTKCNFSTGHYLDSAVIPAIQFIRGYYGVPIKILSSYRTYECNNLAGGATYSRHMKYDAIDWKFTGRFARTMHDRYIDDIKNKGIVFQKLFSIGIRGFGCYPTSNHIDTRENSNMYSWNGKFYNVWGKANELAILAPDYFGVENCEDLNSRR